jgi:hypothetical protein
MTLPVWTMLIVVIIFKISLVAVPDFMRVEPVNISGPVGTARTISGSFWGSEQVCVWD